MPEVEGSQEEIVEFIAQQTNLSLETVARIYVQGEPWPLDAEGFDFEKQAEEAGLSLGVYLQAMNPLIDLDLQEKEAKLKAYEVVAAGGEQPASIPELESPFLNEHIEEVARLTGQDTVVVRQVYAGYLAYLRTIVKKVQSAIDQMMKGDH